MIDWPRRGPRGSLVKIKFPAFDTWIYISLLTA